MNSTLQLIGLVERIRTKTIETAMTSSGPKLLIVLHYIGLPCGYDDA